MQPTVCTKCKKNAAVIFITKIENGIQTDEGLCLKCASELNIKPIQDAIRKLGMSKEEIELLTDEMAEAFGSPEGLSELGDFDGGGRTATFPFLNRLYSGPDNIPPRGGPGPGPAPRPWRQEPQQDASKRKKFLENFCISLTGRAREGKLDRMVGRDSETERVVQILNRRQKNNPCLIGEPGVGKTAIAEGLAQRIADSEVPYKLQDKEVYMLDLTALVAGTQFRGQFEGRMKGLIEEIKALGNIILVIDEVHNLVGAGDAEGSMNAANILKPALSRGEIQVIGATTF
ncbi:MAG: AAA family ATPase, partial [Oscillospiraceae bacterium]|nr:AAA family ATPase [Oscillospiraceae bacterium]